MGGRSSGGGGIGGGDGGKAGSRRDRRPMGEAERQEAARGRGR